ncbi:hypothetical protein F5888DRAFT_1801529 [Russula emetica]|nr:hypothetical protein F5888DRAFT_1801529 [Russula emetica]
MSDDIPRLLSPQTDLDRFVLMAPSAPASSGLGCWVASLERLRALELDLTGRTGKAVDDFFRRIKKSTKKSKKRSVEERAPIVGAFVTLRVLQLTGEVTIVSSLRRIASLLTHPDLAIEDAFDKTEWRNLCVLLSQSFGDSLQPLKISAGGASRFNDLMRATFRGEAISRRLSLESLMSLALASISQTSRPPSTGITLDVVMNGDALVDPRMYLSCCVLAHATQVTPHSWVHEPLTAALALSHGALHADTLWWFHETNRPGFVETCTLGWQCVLEMLPHLQDVCLTER